MQNFKKIKPMLKIISDTIRSYLILCGIMLNGIAINFLATKAPKANELVIPTPKEFMQIFTYGKRFTAAVMLILLVVSICNSFLNYHEEKKYRKRCDNLASESQSERKNP